MTITREELEAELAAASDERLPPVHPGEILRDWLEEEGITAYRLAKAMGVQQTRLAEILAGKRGVSVDTAIRLGKAMGTSAEFWIGLQTAYELELARRAGVGKDVERVAA